MIEMAAGLRKRLPPLVRTVVAIMSSSARAWASSTFGSMFWAMLGLLLPQREGEAGALLDLLGQLAGVEPRGSVRAGGAVHLALQREVHLELLPEGLGVAQ